MFIRPFHLWVGAVVSLAVVFMITVAMHTVLLVAQRIAELELEEDEEISQSEDVANDDELPESEPAQERVTEVTIIPPDEFLIRSADELPAEWKVVEVDEPEKQPDPVKRIDEFVEAIGREAETTPDAARISEKDMAAGSIIDAGDPDGPDVPTTADGRDDSRLDSLIDSELGEADSPGAGGVGEASAIADVPVPPMPVVPPTNSLVANVTPGAARIAPDVIEIPGLDQIPTVPDESSHDGETSGSGEGDDEGDGQTMVPPIPPSSSGSGDIQRLKRRFNGRLDANGINSLAARGTPVGKYLAIVSKRVTRNWQRACRDPINGQHITNGLVKAVITVAADGTVLNVTIEHSEGATTVQQNFTRESAEKTKLPEFSDELRNEVGDEPIEIVFSFLFFVG